MVTKYDICKILHSNELLELISTEIFVGSSDDRRDGFIHLSTNNQVAGTIQKHFKNQRNLYLLGLIAADLKSTMKWERSRGGALFPHLYAPLELRYVKVIFPIPPSDSAEFQAFISQVGASATG